MLQGHIAKFGGKTTLNPKLITITMISTNAMVISTNLDTGTQLQCAQCCCFGIVLSSFNVAIMAEKKMMKGNSEDFAKMFMKATTYTALRHLHLPKKKAVV
jgi:hypothetical protein